MGEIEGPLVRWLNELALEHPAEQPALMERRLVEIEAPAKLDVRFGRRIQLVGATHLILRRQKERCK